jgi:hypothetical protein
LEFLQLSENILFFVALHGGEPHGMMEYWSTGYKKRERSIIEKMLYLHFIMMPVRHPVSTFAPENTQLLRENQYNSFFYPEL